ncbi:MAG: ATP synthase subunit I [Rhodospirillales bacterium]
MTAVPPAFDVVQLTAASLAGFAAGLAYFAQLRLAVASLVAQRGWWRPLALTLGRFALALALFAAAAGMGTSALIGALAGFLAARGVALRRMRQAP